MKNYDVIVIGAGPGGYVAAIRCAQLGKKTAIVEKYSTLGGTCLNVGCIPSKALLDSTHLLDDAHKHAPIHGIDIAGEITVDFPKMVARKQAVVDQNTQGINFLMKKNNVDVFHGKASFVSPTELPGQGAESETLSATHFIIATGSKPSALPFISIDKERVITSTEALSLKEVPKHLIVIGGGVIGLELGQVYLRLGAQVSVVEYAASILPTMDAAIGKELSKVLKKQGFEFYTDSKVKEVTRTGDTVTVKADGPKGEIVLEGDYCLVATGRRPYTEGLGLDKAGVQLNQRGQIEVNDHLQTSAAHIYAIGDVIRGAMLAHKAEEEGVYVAELLAGEKSHVNYDLIPGAVYTTPGRPYKVGQFPMRALGRARASLETDGFVKVLADATTDEILGVHILGARASDLIAQSVVAMEYRASAEDIARICHAHPTYSEAVKEACLDATAKRAIHM